MLKTHICFVPSFTVAERRALLSLHLNLVALYNFFININMLILQVNMFPSLAAL